MTDLLGEAMANLADGLSFQVGEAEQRRGRIVEMRRDRHFAGSALAVPGVLVEQLAEYVGDKRLVAGLACADHLLLTGESSDWVDEVKEATRSHGHQTEFVQPSVFLVDDAGIELIERY